MTFFSLHRRLRESQAGFSLIELVVTVSIIAVLLGVAVPGMVDLVKDARLSSQADLLVSTLNIARLEAVKQKADMELCPVSSNADSAAACSAAATDWGKGWLIVKVSDGSIVQRVPTKSGLSVTNTTSPTALALVTFNSTIGSASAATGFNLCVTGRKQQVVSIAASGHVSKSISSTIC